jgi:hypothetical protein
VKAVSAKTRPSEAWGLGFLRRDKGLQAGVTRHGNEICTAMALRSCADATRHLARNGIFLPSTDWQVGVCLVTLVSFCGSDLKGLGHRQKSKKLTHYRYRVPPKPSGEIRLIGKRKTAAEGTPTLYPFRNSQQNTAASCRAWLHSRALYQTFMRPTRDSVILRMDLDISSRHSARSAFRLGHYDSYPEPMLLIRSVFCTNCTRA